MKTLAFKRKTLDLSQPQVMGILNTTPDSFSDGGRYQQLQAAIEQGLAMVKAGATLLDIGGESTRPGAKDVGVDEELDRVIPVIRGIRQFDSNTLISVDTSKPEVMLAAVEAGADMINDVYALRREGALQAAAECQVPVCLMHMQGEPRTMQANPSYDDLITDINAFFEERILACLEAGIAKELLLLDPGLGFGKSLVHNYQIMNQLKRFSKFELPLLVGASRKSMIGTLLNKPVQQRVAGSVSAALYAAVNGAQILRVHDVAQTCDALAVWTACENPIIT
ncbi:dihydropteroate synthase [Paraferrimonas haliotis]|uniref:Dihydropteroate synthase n=1 Tax=Paraferrimonas haliotis TaxID=2013866 RepID=A0AA37TSM2_9GAMM|nr:dihydropteroate synthase [Paraferrimonas haliotis]GLS83671.1 dihydropteroate synthase [Paraferrimonas haliotis]